MRNINVAAEAATNEDHRFLRKLLASKSFLPLFVLDKKAGVLDDGESGGASFFSGGGARDVLLKPKNLGSDRNSRIGDGGNLFRSPKNVDDVNGFRDVFEASESLNTEDLRFVWIDRDDLVAGRLQIGGYSVRGTKRVGRETNDRDGLGGSENVINRVQRGSGGMGPVEVHRGWMSCAGLKVMPAVYCGARRPPLRRSKA